MADLNWNIISLLREAVMEGLIQEAFCETNESQDYALFDKPVSKLDETAVPGPGPNWPVPLLWKRACDLL